MSNSSHNDLKTVYLPIKPWSVGNNALGNEFGGILGKMMDLMSLNLNVTFNISESQDWNAFTKRNGKWVGLMKQLLDGEVDVILGPIIPSEDQVADFHVLPTYYEVPSYLTLASTSNYRPTNFFSFLLTFDIEIWYGIMVALATLIIVSSVSDHFSYNVKRHISKPFKETLSGNFWMYLAAFFNEGSPRNPPSSRSRFTLAIGLLAMIVLLNSFSGQFKALLLISQGGDKMTDVNDLARRTDLVPTFPDYWTLYHCLRDTNLEVYKKIWKTIEKHGVSNAAFHMSKFHDPELYQRVKDGKSVLIAGPNIIKMNFAAVCQELKGRRTVYTFDGVCSMFSFSFLATPGIDKNVLKAIHQRVRWMFESYLIDKWINEQSRNYWKCFYKAEHNDATPLTMNNLFGAFALLLLLQLVSTFVFLVELLRHKLFRAK